MHATPDSSRIATVAIDLAKDVFELAFADAQGQLVERRRLSRAAFAKTFGSASPLRQAQGRRKAQRGLIGPAATVTAARHRPLAERAIPTGVALFAWKGARLRIASGRAGRA